MSFSTDIKTELAHDLPHSSCCASAELAGFIRACGFISLAGKKGVGLRMETEHAAVARHIKTLTRQSLGIDLSLMVGDAAIGRGKHLYALVLTPGAKAHRLLSITGVLKESDGKYSMSAGFPQTLFRRKCCRKSCLKGLFLGAGTMCDPEKAYDLELVLSNEQNASAAKRILNSFVDIQAKSRVRRGSHVVYLNDSEQIKDVLNIMGAHAQLLKYESSRVIKEVRNKTNRINNCDSANFYRTQSAADKQLEVINRLKDSGELDTLPDKLIDTALLRLEHPDATLAELGALHEPKINKSAVAARMKKIMSS